LKCELNHSFNIQDGLPNFLVDKENNKDKLKFQEENTVDSFGFEWTWDNVPRTESDLHFRVLEKAGINESFLKNKIILDAGCGAGLQTSLMSKYAEVVVGADLSEAAKVAYKNNLHNDNVSIIHADILNLPFNEGVFDYIYCEGVLQHTMNPEKAFYKLVSLLKKGGQIFATFYTRREGKISPFLLFREPLRFILSRLPKRVCWYICWFSIPLNKIPLMKYIFRKTIILYDKRNPSDKSVWCLNYDFYGVHKYQFYFRPSEIRDIWDKCDTKLKILYSENGYPLRGEKE
jgi:SAM-dependent methyltransferase